ncbi:ribosomal RNA-processing protein 8 isoform X1 [Loxodonta africana]|uniref:ribosomal RNA-processing protein 8 isoform X1 n=1 Tax=Loxodonta africana TaxID=9785 RepID=UPI0030D4766F
MFEEPEWTEEALGATAFGPVAAGPRPAAAVRIKNSSILLTPLSYLAYPKGSKHRKLLATLRALEAASLPQQPPSLPESDSEEEEIERKKKRPKKALFASASAEVKEKRKNKHQKQTRSGSDSEDEEVERKKKSCKRALLGSESVEEEKRKRKCQKQAPSSRAQHLDSVDQTGSKVQKGSAADDPHKPSLGSASPQLPHTLSRKQWRNRQKNKRRHKNKFRPPQPPTQALALAPTEEAEVPPPPRPDSYEARAGALRARMVQRLDGARFRYLNEQLYSGPSSAAQRLFQEDPEAFLIYHRGFQSQVNKWPLQPVDRIIRDLRQRPVSLVVADFGCGDCRLASSIRNPVHCFDLASLDPRVTVCDMAQVPLEDESVDVAVFCLSLMGTNIRDFLEEANRVLKPGGLLKVAEVSSRFQDVRAFLGAVTKLGFKVISKDLTNSHFFLFDFQKTGPPLVGPKAELSGLKLQPCLYKRR